MARRTSKAKFLDPPLHRICGGPGTMNVQRILYLDDNTGDWILWKSFNVARIRDGVFRLDRLKYRGKHKLVRQSHELPIEPEDLK